MMRFKSVIIPYKTITDEDVINFAKLTGDVNPIHILDSFAKRQCLKNALPMVCSFRVLFLPSLERNSQAKYNLFIPKCFIPCPVKIGDTLRVVAEVIKKRDDKNHYVANKYI